MFFGRQESPVKNIMIEECVGMSFRIYLSWVLVLCLSGSLSAQETSFNAGSGTVPEGGSGTLSLTMDNSGQEIAGGS